MHRHLLLQRPFTTVLFTDIANAGDRAAELGEEAWHVLAQKHDALVRRELRRWRASEAVNVGGGLVAAFDQPAWAIRCAWAICAALRSLGLEVRSGLYLGEVRDSEDALRGPAVEAAASITAEAEAGELLVSETIRDVLAKAGFIFEERGALPGGETSAEWRLFAVTKIPSPPEPSLLPWWVPRLTRSQMVAAVVLALAIVVAGILYVVNRVWP